MTGVELLLLLVGSIFMIGSFFITEKLSPSELNKIAALSEEELKKIIDRGLDNAAVKIEDAIDTQIGTSTAKVDRALEKETNEKIMAISEYSDTVMESMNKAHNEIMFLYSMLNDKHQEMTGMFSELQRLAADVRSLQENYSAHAMQAGAPGAASQGGSAQAAGGASSAKAAPGAAKGGRGASAKGAAATAAKGGGDAQGGPANVSGGDAAGAVIAPSGAADGGQGDEKDSVHKEILAMHREGINDVEIAKRLGMGIGEVKLIIGLYRGE